MGDSQNWFDLGLALLEQENFSDAITAFDKAITYNQYATDAWFNRGVACAQIGKYQQALHSFDQTLLLDPGYENAIKARTMVLALMEKKKIANGTRDVALPPQRFPFTVPATPKPVPSTGRKSIRSPLLAVIFSFLFTGWGQWYNGERWKGLIFFGIRTGVGILSIALILLMKGNPVIYAACMIPGLAIWIYGMYDAYITAEKINRGEIGFTRKSRLFWLPVVLFVVMIVVTILLAAVIAAFVFGMAGNIQHTKVVAATAQQTDATHIVVTYQGGQDADQVSMVTVKVTDSDGRYQTKSMGDPGIKSPAPGDTLTFVGTAGKDHVVAAAVFTDSSSQVILDTYI
jgi:archaeal type IV pilus assembly protein PilA